MRPRALLVLTLAFAGVLAAPRGAAAHGGAPVGPDALWTAWTLDPLILAPLLLLHWLYGRGAVRLGAHRRRGRHLGRREMACFLGAELALVAALVSPLEALSGTLLSAHMAQHALLIAVAPPLLLLARPEAALVWALPRRWRRRLARSAVRRRLGGLLRRLERPQAAVLLHGAAIWIWHAPAAFEAALGNAWLHHLEHLSFFATALLFWRGVLRARSPRGLAAAAVASLATMMHMALLGALLTFAARPLYPGQGPWSRLWGLTPLEDQQLAGLLMWVPGGLAYLAAAVAIAARLAGAVERGAATGRPRAASRSAPRRRPPRSWSAAPGGSRSRACPRAGPRTRRGAPGRRG